MRLRQPAPRRASIRWRRLAWGIVPGLLLACSSAPSVLPRYYQLRDDPPPGAAAAEPAAALAARGGDSAAPGPVWQLGVVTLPVYLDRDEMVMPSGRAGLQPQPAYRWAEPLRDAVPRLLRRDLGRLLGADRVWDAALPAGMQPDRLVRVELTRFEPEEGGRAVVLHARWHSIDPATGRLVHLHEESLRADSAGADADSLAAAHRQAVWLLAQRIAAAERETARVTRPAPPRPGSPSAR